MAFVSTEIVLVRCSISTEIVLVRCSIVLVRWSNVLVRYSISTILAVKLERPRLID